MAFTYSLEARIARAQADFEEGYNRGSYALLRDRQLPYYIEKYDLPISKNLENFLERIDKTTPYHTYEKSTPDQVKKALNGINNLYFSDMQPVAHKILLDGLLYDDEFNEARKFILQNIQKENSEEIITKFIKEQVAADLFLIYPTRYSTKNKLNITQSADLIYASKIYYHETHDKYAINLYNDLKLIKELDDLKSKINTHHRPQLTYYQPSTTYEVDFDERESASADRCF